jgi:hypothetical protein
MNVRFKFSADLYIEGNDMNEIREKFQGMPLFSKEASDNGVEYNELLLVEDGDTYKDLMSDYFNY